MTIQVVSNLPVDTKTKVASSHHFRWKGFSHSFYSEHINCAREVDLARSVLGGRGSTSRRVYRFNSVQIKAGLVGYIVAAPYIHILSHSVIMSKGDLSARTFMQLDL